MTEVDYQRTVGKNKCVATTENDEIFYAQRPRQDEFWRWVANREAEPCSAVVVILTKPKFLRGAYKLVNTYAGNKSKPLPWDEDAFLRETDDVEAARQASQIYWSTRAMVLSGGESAKCFRCQTEVSQLGQDAHQVAQVLYCSGCRELLMAKFSSSDPNHWGKRSVELLGWGPVWVPDLD